MFHKPMSLHGLLFLFLFLFFNAIVFTKPWLIVEYASSEMVNCLEMLRTYG
jgi:hypothetical protein